MILTDGLRQTHSCLTGLRTWHGRNSKTFLNKVFFIEKAKRLDFFKPIRKVAHIFPKVPHRVCIISICSIQILLSILRSLTQSCVQQHRMKTPLKKHLTSVGVYASIYPKNTDTLRYGTASASWVNTTMDSKPTVLFIGKKSGWNPVEKVAHIFPIRT